VIVNSDKGLLNASSSLQAKRTRNDELRKSPRSHRDAGKSFVARIPGGRIIANKVS